MFYTTYVYITEESKHKVAHEGEGNKEALNIELVNVRFI